MCLTEKCILHKASEIIVLSRYISNKLTGIHKIPVRKVVKIPGGVDSDFFLLPDKEKKTCPPLEIFGLSNTIPVIFPET